VNPYGAALILLGAVIAQVALMPSAALGSAVPLLTLLVVVSWGYVRGARQGMAWALAAGLLSDVMSPKPIGTYTLPLMAAALVVGLGAGRLADAIFMPAALTTVATIVFIAGQIVVLGLIGDIVDLRPEALVPTVLPTVLLNLLWLPIVYFPLRWLARRSGPPRLAWER
jgi:rod shape-determining protein MreD